MRYIIIILLATAAVALAAPCNNWSPLANGVDAQASVDYGFVLPKYHHDWKLGDAGSISATGTVLCNKTSGPGLLLVQKYLVQELVDTTGFGTTTAAQSRADSSTNWWTIDIIVDGKKRLIALYSLAIESSISMAPQTHTIQSERSIPGQRSAKSCFRRSAVSRRGRNMRYEI